MPAIITHNIFGNKSVDTLPLNIIHDSEEKNAFIMANQGPDPFFFTFRGLPRDIMSSHAAGSIMHAEKCGETFVSFRHSIEEINSDDKNLALAFALGVLSHYSLDSCAHPYVYSVQNKLVDTSNGKLKGYESQVHGVIESRIDSYLLWKTYHMTIDQKPKALELEHSKRCDKVAGVLFSKAAADIYNIEIAPGVYGQAASDMRLFYKIMEPAGSTGIKIASKLEKLTGHSYSLLESLTHEKYSEDLPFFANETYEPWTDPNTGQERMGSFEDLFEAALVKYKLLTSAFLDSDEALLAAVGNINYSGE